MYAYGFSINAVTFFNSYLKRRNQHLRINNIHSVYRVLLYGVPQGSILGPLLFDVFINELYLYITKTDLLYFVDDNTITAGERAIANLISTLVTESQVAIEWFKLNKMIFNSEKFQTIVVMRNAKMRDSYPLNINDLTTNS